jgi:uncharacterized protein (TIGR02284 family)
MWRNENQIAINEIIVAAQEITDQYQYAAETVGDDGLRTLFDDLAIQRQAVLDRLITYIDRSGELHDVPDNDRETLQQLFSQIKTLFAQDERLVFLEERTQAEAEFEKMLKSALALSWETEIKQQLQQLLQLAASAQQRLNSTAQTLGRGDD